MASSSDPGVGEAGVGPETHRVHNWVPVGMELRFAFLVNIRRDRYIVDAKNKKKFHGGFNYPLPMDYEADNEVHLVDGEVGEEEDLAAVEWDRENPQMEEGSIFASMSECRNALVTYCIKAERTFEVDKSDQVKVNPLKHRCEESTLRKETISRAKSRWVAEEVNVDPSFGESFDENVDTNEDQNVDPNEEENVDPNDDPNEAPNDPNDDPNEDQNEAPNEAPNDGGQPSVVASSASSVVVSKNKVKEPTTKRRKEEAMSTRITRSKVDARRTRITRSKVDATSTRITRSKVDARRTRITRSKKL
ncbi:hypothetical protein ACQ4PT_016455 [Festuca glaucescens]